MEDVRNKRYALVVDDDEPIRMMVRRLLRREGFEVDTARDGLHAIDALRAREYDLVLLDLMMPRVDGYGVIRFLEMEKPEVLSNIIVMTALTHVDIEQQICRIVKKPFDVEELASFARSCVADNSSAA